MKPGQKLSKTGMKRPTPGENDGRKGLPGESGRDKAIDWVRQPEGVAGRGERSRDERRANSLPTLAAPTDGLGDEDAANRKNK